MTAPKVFGREMKSFSGSYSVTVGFMRLGIERYDNGEYDPSISVGDQVIADTAEMFLTIDGCITWLESTARRIMRECFEMAGELESVETRPSGINDFVYERTVPVRFR